MYVKDYVVDFNRFSTVNENYNEDRYDYNNEEADYDYNDDDDDDDDDFQNENLADEIDSIRENLMDYVETSFLNESFSSTEENYAKLVANLLYENAYNLPFVESLSEQIDYLLEEEEAKAAAKPAAKPASQEPSKFKKVMSRVGSAAKSIGFKLKGLLLKLKKKFNYKQAMLTMKYKKDLANIKKKYKPFGNATLEKQLKDSYDSNMKQLKQKMESEISVANRSSKIHGAKSKSGNSDFERNARRAARRSPAQG